MFGCFRDLGSEKSMLRVGVCCFYERLMFSGSDKGDAVKTSSSDQRDLVQTSR